MKVSAKDKFAMEFFNQMRPYCNEVKTNGSLEKGKMYAIGHHAFDPRFSGGIYAANTRTQKSYEHEDEW